MNDIYLKPGTYAAEIPSKEKFLKANGQSLQKFLSQYLATTSVCCAKHFVGSSLTVPTITLSSKGAATQDTSITTEVALNAASGIVTTVSATTAADASSSFTVTNTSVLATSIVLANIVNYAGTDGVPSVIVEDIAAGSFKITIYNGHSTDALNGVLKIGFVVL